MFISGERQVIKYHQEIKLECARWKWIITHRAQKLKYFASINCILELLNVYMHLHM